MSVTEFLSIDPADERYWSAIKQQYSVSDEFINLDNGFFGIPSQPVLEAFHRYNTLVHQELSYFMRTKLADRISAVRAQLADFCGVHTDELIITRNVTEAMNILIQGYPFHSGDEVVISNQEYPTVIETLEMMQLQQRVTLTRIQLPLYATDEEIISLYEQAINPKTKVLILTHMLHMTGRILPVADIARMARRYGVDVFVDAAHSFAQIDFQIPALHTDFMATNLHKWLGAPLGVGLLYIRKERIGDITPLFGNMRHSRLDIQKFSQVGTSPPAPILAVEDALIFHNAIGSKNKECRLRYLKNYWVERIKDFRQIEVITPGESNQSCAIAAFRLKGANTIDTVQELMQQHQIFTVALELDGEYLVRVVPSLHTTPEQLQRLVNALQRFA